MTVRDQNGFIDWDAGREGYERSTPTVYAAGAKNGKPMKDEFAGVRWEERLGSLTAACGLIWGVYIATQNYTDLMQLDITKPGPLEICALGILAWLHAKWRRSMRAR